MLLQASSLVAHTWIETKNWKTERKETLRIFFSSLFTKAQLSKRKISLKSYVILYLLLKDLQFFSRTSNFPLRRIKRRKISLKTYVILYLLLKSLQFFSRTSNFFLYAVSNPMLHFIYYWRPSNYFQNPKLYIFFLQSPAIFREVLKSWLFNYNRF